MRYPTLLLIFASLSSGCAPDRLAAEVADRNLSVAPQIWRNASDPNPTDQDNNIPNLWVLTDHQALHQLIKAALAANPDLQIAALRLKETQALTRVSRGALLPTLSFNGNARRQRAMQSTTATASWQGNVTWEMDLWGRLGDQVMASMRRSDAVAADLAAARNSIAANVIRTVLDLAVLDKTLQIDAQRIVSSSLNENSIRERYLAGLGSLADLEAARTVLQRQRAARFERQESQARLHRALLVLLGDFNTDVRIPENLEISLPLTPLPLEVLNARPDVYAASARIQAAEYDLAAAKRARLPRLNFVLDHVRSGTSPAEALSLPGISSLLTDLALPIFRGGQLKAEQDRSAIVVERTLWSYRNVVLAALQEVEDGIEREASLNKQVAALQQAQTHAANNRASVEGRYSDGLVTIFDLLDAQQSFFDARTQLLNTELLRQQNRVNLALALGLGV
ncbi:MAG: TolC family protein [Pseudomonadota bacterium]